MQKIIEAIDKAKHEYKSADHYADLALQYKESDKALADVYAPSAPRKSLTVTKSTLSWCGSSRITAQSTAPRIRSCRSSMTSSTKS